MSCKFQVGQRVQALWKGEWERAIIRKVERDGDCIVQFEDDDEDDLTHLDVKHVRKPKHDDNSSSSSSSSSDEDDNGSAHKNKHKPLKGDKVSHSHCDSDEKAAAKPDESVAALAAFQAIRAKIPQQFSLLSHRDRVVESDDDQFEANSSSLDKSKNVVFCVEYVDQVHANWVYLRDFKSGKYWSVKPAEKGFLKDKVERVGLYDKTPAAEFEWVSDPSDSRLVSLRSAQTGKYVRGKERLFSEDLLVDAAGIGSWEKFKLVL